MYERAGLKKTYLFCFSYDALANLSFVWCSLVSVRKIARKKTCNTVCILCYGSGTLFDLCCKDFESNSEFNGKTTRKVLTVLDGYVMLVESFNT